MKYEQKLKMFAKTIASKNLHQPVRDEIVLVKHFAMQKWVRCKVEAVECSGVPEFTVWLIDYGQPLRTQAKWIRPLNTELAEFEIPLIYKAGLANIVPAATVFNMEKAELEHIKTKNWSDDVVTTIESIMTENSVVFFTPIFKINTHFFGNVEVLTRQRKVIELRDVILSLSCGRLTYNLQEFSDDLKIGCMTNFGRFETQASQSAFAVKNNQISESVQICDSNKLAAVPTINSHPESIQKVTEWKERNLRAEVKDCPPEPENATAIQYSQPRQPVHFKPGDDFEPSLMGCAGSREHRKLLEKNKQPDVVKTNQSTDFLARLRQRSEKVNKLNVKPPKREPPMVPAGFSLNQLHTVVRPTRSDDQKRNFENNSLTKAHETNFSNTLNYIHRSPQQFDRSANRASSASNVNTSGNFAEGNQPHKSAHRTSLEQKVIDEPKHLSSVNSRITHYQSNRSN